MDVYVDHRVYGTIHKLLDIRLRRDLKHIMDDMQSGVSTPLKNITNSYHFHTVEARSEAIIREIEKMLRVKGYLIDSFDSPVFYKPKSYSNK